VKEMEVDKGDKAIETVSLIVRGGPWNEQKFVTSASTEFLIKRDHDRVVYYYKRNYYKRINAGNDEAMNDEWVLVNALSKQIELQK